ncbi:MAG: periplasmic heavy metal sensor [Opitutaceae bacterium]
MKKLFILLGLIAVAGVTTYAICYRWAMASVEIVTPDGTDAELAWLKQEFALEPAQFARVSALHHAYRPKCADHCAHYMAVHQRLNSLMGQETVWSPEVGEAIATLARIQGECHASMLEYAYDVAACMSPAEGRRYLEMIKLQIIPGDPAGMFAAAR